MISRISPSTKNDRKFNPAAIPLRQAESRKQVRERFRTTHNGLMFKLASSTPGDDCDSCGSCAGSAVNYQAIYSNRESVASAFPHPGCSKGIFSVRQVRRCREPGDGLMACCHDGANPRDRTADFPRWRAASTIQGARGCTG